MPFNVANIRDKASQAKNSTVNKFQDTRDKYSSAPMAKTKFAEGGYVPDARKSPPPPPPPRTGASPSPSFTSGSRDSLDGARPPPPPVARFTKPSSYSNREPTASPAPATPSPFSRRGDTSRSSIDEIDWANLAPEDKREFFKWLDEFFERFLTIGGKASSTRNNPRHTPEVVVDQVLETPSPPPVSASIMTSTSPSRGPPPIIKAWSKPVIETVVASNVDFKTSYPPPTTYGSQALDLAYYFHPETAWDDQWYAEEHGVPPPLKDNNNRLYKGQYSFRGNMKSSHFGVIFSSLSLCWYTISYSTPNPSQVERHAEYLDPPGSLPRDVLVEAHETYGETIAAYAESFLGSGQFCARGECWDLANEGLKYFEQYDYVPKPVPSLNRTHGHLIFEGKALGKNKQVGRWRGGDDRVRRGDIVEWRSVKIGLVDGPRGGWAILGDPEHTAVITKDSVPTREPRDGESLLPSELLQLEVVEQSRNNQPPEPNKKAYDMAAFEEGEVWIYRPISMQVYLGISELSHSPPGDISTLSI